jgi:putative inorganic carbon (hco3(-)) transporter
MTFLTLAMFTTRERLNWLIIMIVFSLGFYGVRGGVFSIMTGGNYRVWGPSGSFFEDNNQLALTLIMTLPLMHYLQLISTNKWVRHLLSAVMLLTLGAIIGTYSRGALLALTAMGGVLWLKSSKKLPVAFASVICIIGVLSFMPQKWFDRMDTINTYEEDESASGRFDAWIFAIHVANDKVLGGGFKVNTRSDLWPIYNPESPIVRAPHSIYFEVLGEHGYIGLSIFLTLLFTAMLTCSRTVKLTKHRPDLKWAGDLSKMMQVSLVGYCAAGAFLNLSTFDLFYHVLAIIVIARILAMKELAHPYVEATDALDTDDASSPAIAKKAVGATVGAGRNAGAPGQNPVLGGASGYLINRR